MIIAPAFVWLLCSVVNPIKATLFPPRCRQHWHPNFTPWERFFCRFLWGVTVAFVILTAFSGREILGPAPGFFFFGLFTLFVCLIICLLRRPAEVCQPQMQGDSSPSQSESIDMVHWPGASSSHIAIDLAHLLGPVPPLQPFFFSPSELVIDLVAQCRRHHLPLIV